MNDNSYKVIEADINEILPNRFQPRIQFDEDEILELSDSIKEHGVIQPIVVRTIGDKYEIIAGERRYKASVLAGKETVPIIIKNLNDKDSAEIALIENIQRKNLTPIEEALSYKKILDMGYLTQETLASKLGKSQPSIANKIRLLNLSDEVQEALLDNKISERHARSLLRLKSLSDQNHMLNRIIDERLTVRKTDDEIDKILNASSDSDGEEKIIEKGDVNMNNEINQIPNVVVPPTNNFDIFATPTMEVPQAPAVPEIPSVPTMEVPQVPQVPAVPEIPSVPTMEVPQVPAVPEIPSVPTIEVPQAPAVPEIPSVPTIEVPQVPAVPEIPSVPTIEVPQAPAVPEIPSVPTIEVPQAPAVPEIPSVSTMEVPQVPAVPEIPSVPTMEVPQAPAVPEIPSVPTMEVPQAPAVPEILSVPTIGDSQLNINENEISKLSEDNEEQGGMPEISLPIPEMAPIIENEISPEMEVSSNLTIEPSQAPNKLDAINLESDISDTQNNNELIKPEPIIITDYNKQYDPIMPNSVEQPVTKVDFKEIINAIRECSEKIEQYGYRIDVEEYDLSTIYQVVFKVEK